MKDKVKESILNILKENRLLSLATIGNNSPYICSAYYVYDKNLNLYIWTDKNSSHAKNIEKNNKVAVNIANTSQKWGSELKGLQISGIASKVSLKEIAIPASLYLKRYPKAVKSIKNIKDFNTKFNSILYKIKINCIKVLDEKTFGKENYKEIKC